MIAKVLRDYLSEELSVGVYMEQPEELTDYVLLDQTGSSKREHITTTTIAVQSYGASLYAAMQLNERVKAAMEDFVALDEVAKVELETDYNFTNTATKQYRWQAVFNITHYC